ncbi:Werner Syndrome-like exonuclease [Solanum stenotomum]|uniref:Werner Syndrome-like exonuclease n=1 Tax=Solanum stenotomum TaxID=172797 RepID=UPI0020D149EE|nr:Werner Syndrome-like exonuclease [Solanum stenotomum]
MNQSIVAHQVQDHRYRNYDVYFYGDSILIIVTADPEIVTHWITDVEFDVSFRDVVGLDIEWRPNYGQTQNPVATLQLCVGHSCLIFRLLHCHSPIPQSLVTFLDTYTFAGVEIEVDVEKLERDHGLIVSYSVDLRELAATAYEAFGLVYQIRKNARLKELCSVVLLKEMVKPAHITRSRWDYRFLNEEQVEYACIDAFVYFEIEKRLNTSGYGCNWL